MSKQNDTTNSNNRTRRVTFYQNQNARKKGKRARSLSRTHTTSTQYLKRVQVLDHIYNGPPQCWLTEIKEQNDQRVNSSRIIEAKYVEIRDLINRGTFRNVLRTELTENTKMITERFILVIKSNKDKGKDVMQNMSLASIFYHERVPIIWSENQIARFRAYDHGCNQSQRFSPTD